MLVGEFNWAKDSLNVSLKVRGLVPDHGGLQSFEKGLLVERKPGNLVSVVDKNCGVLLRYLLDFHFLH